MKRCHPLLLSMTQLKAQIPKALQCLPTTRTRHPINTHISGTSDLQLQTELSAGVSKSESNRVPDAKHAARPFFQPTPAYGEEEVPLLQPSLKLGLEQQTGHSTHRGKNSLLPFSVEDPWQQHFSTTDSNNSIHTSRSNKVSF